MENSSNLRTDGNRLIFDRPSGLEDRLTTVQEFDRHPGRGMMRSRERTDVISRRDCHWFAQEAVAAIKGVERGQAAKVFLLTFIRKPEPERGVLRRF
jgi:hypothetical protein